MFEREPADPALMRRPPRARNARLLDARSVASGLGHGTLAFLAVAAAYFAAGHAGLAQPQVAATAFIALVSGNLALIRLNRAGASRRGGEQAPNRVFAIVCAGAATMLMSVLATPALERWFHFASPPASAGLLALLLPWLLLGVVAALRRRSPPAERGAERRRTEL